MTFDKNSATLSEDANTQTSETNCNGTGTHDDIVMESGGVIDESCPNYVEEDDVKDSIAEGYF